jgi:hypothetical protein
MPLFEQPPHYVIHNAFGVIGECGKLLKLAVVAQIYDFGALLGIGNCKLFVIDLNMGNDFSNPFKELDEVVIGWLIQHVLQLQLKLRYEVLLHQYLH